MHELKEAAQLIQEAEDPDANIIFGHVIDNRLQDEVKLTLIATGFDNNRRVAHGRPPQMVPKQTAVAEARPAPAPKEDLEIPAFLRLRQR